MSNRLTRNRRAVIGGCVFAAFTTFCLFAGVAQAAGMSVMMTATGDRINADAQITWAGSSGDLQVLPNLTCGQEVLTGAYSSSLLSTGGGAYKLTQATNDEDIMQFTSQTDMQISKGVYSEFVHVFDVGAGTSPGLCEGAEINTSMYNEMAYAGSNYAGEGLQYKSAIGVSQASAEMPDSLAMDMQAAGSGRITVSAGYFSQVGIGNSTALGLMNTMDTRVTSSGKDMTAGMAYRWSSFTSAFGGALEPVGEQPPTFL